MKVISYNLSPDLLVKMWIAARKRVPIVRFLNKYGYLIAFIVSLILFLLFIIPERDILRQWPDLVCLTVVFTCISFALGLGLYHFLRLTTIRHFKKRIAKAVGQWPKILFGEWKVIVSEQGLSIIDPGRERFYRWEILKGIEQEDNFIFVDAWDGSGTIVPETAFANQQDMIEFLDVLAQNIVQDSAKQLGVPWIKQSTELRVDKALQKANWCIVYAISAIICGPIIGVFFGGLSLYKAYRLYKVAESMLCAKCIQRLQIARVLSTLAVVGWAIFWVLVL